MDKPVIGLTGPTGAGKTTVAAAFRRHGCAVVDADRIARDVVSRPQCRDGLRAAFGGEIFRRYGSLDRRKLAEVAFSSPENTKKLNAVTHPVIIAESEKKIAAARAGGCRAVILDAPLLFESGAGRLCDATVAVITPDASRLRRIIARDGLPEATARVRMAAQHGNGYFRARADYLFDGDAEWRFFYPAAEALLNRILGDLNEKA